MKDSVIIAQTEIEYNVLNAVSNEARKYFQQTSSYIFTLENKISSLEQKNEVLKKENEELKQKLEKKNQLFSFWPKIRKI